MTQTAGTLTFNSLYEIRYTYHYNGKEVNIAFNSLYEIPGWPWPFDSTQGFFFQFSL